MLFKCVRVVLCVPGCLPGVANCNSAASWGKKKSVRGLVTELFVCIGKHLSEI